MKINFFLPGFPSKPMGGYKVVYQYANYLSSNGHDVCIYYGCYDPNNRKISLKTKIKNIIKKMALYFYPNWFDLNKKIKQKCVLSFKNNNIRNADKSIATFILTAEPIFNLSSKKGEKYYFIQDFEAWLGITEKEVLDSYKLDMKKIVISDWLNEIVKKNCDDKIAVVRNGIDLNKFKVTNDIEHRNKLSISMLYHTDERKGSKYGLMALKRLHEMYPELQVNLFGTIKRNNDIPDWIKYTQNASEEEVVKILNSSSIFICTSLYEGFGLPGIESMACGCALISTQTKGVLEYANSSNSILIEPKNVEQIISSVEYLINNNNYRIEMAKRGNDDIKLLDINLAYEKFENVLKNK